MSAKPTSPKLTRTGPSSRIYFSQRLRLHYADWGNEDKPPLLLVHGGRDHCRSWDWVAEQFMDDYHVIAPDLRGHGDSQWSLGSNYAFTEYVYDIAQLIHQLELAPVTILSHSMGGAISLRYTGLYPDSVKKIIAIEGLGPPPKMLEEAAKQSSAERWIKWIDQVRGLAARTPRRYETIDDAIARMANENSFLSPEQARHLTVHGVNQNEDGTYSWKFDNYMHQFGPVMFDPEESGEMWGRITCPTLLVRGTENWASDPEEDGRLAYFKNATFKNIEGAGHWVHHDRFDEFMGLAKDFLAD